MVNVDQPGEPLGVDVRVERGMEIAVDGTRRGRDEAGVVAGGDEAVRAAVGEAVVVPDEVGVGIAAEAVDLLEGRAEFAFGAVEGSVAGGAEVEAVGRRRSRRKNRRFAPVPAAAPRPPRSRQARHRRRGFRGSSRTTRTSAKWPVPDVSCATAAVGITPSVAAARMRRTVGRRRGMGLIRPESAGCSGETGRPSVRTAGRVCGLGMGLLAPTQQAEAGDGEQAGGWPVRGSRRSRIDRRRWCRS